MFSFLVHPKRYISNSIVESTLDELREPRPAIHPRQIWQRWYIYTAWMGFLLFVTLPLWSYIDADKLGFYDNINITMTILCVEILAGVAFAFQIGLMIRTVLMGLYAGRLDTQATSSKRYVLLSRWWAVCRAAAPWMFAAVLVKFFLALGLAQFLHTTDIYGSCLRTVLVPFCHLSNMELRYSHFSWALAAAFALLIFAFLEMGISAATGLLFSALSKKRFSLGFGPAMAARFFVVAAGLGFWLNYAVPGQANMRFSDALTSRQLLWNGILKQTGLSLMTFADGGTLIAADLMRIDSTTLHHLGDVCSLGLALALNIALLWGTLGAAVLVSRLGRVPTQQELTFTQRQRFAAPPQDSAFEQSPADSVPAALIDSAPVGQGD
jgi:hypothetical protein